MCFEDAKKNQTWSLSLWGPQTFPFWKITLDNCIAFFPADNFFGPNEEMRKSIAFYLPPVMKPRRPKTLLNSLAEGTW